MEETYEYNDNPKRNKDVDDVKLWCKALNITPSQFFHMPEEELKLRLKNLKGRLRLRVAKNLIAYQKEKLNELELMSNLKNRNLGNPPQVNNSDWYGNFESTRVRAGESEPRERAGANIWDILCQAADDVEAMYEGSGASEGQASDNASEEQYSEESEDYGDYEYSGSLPYDATGSSGGGSYGIRGLEEMGDVASPGKYEEFSPIPVLQSTPIKPLLYRPVIKSGSVFTSRRSQDSVEMTDYNMYVERSPRGEMTRITSKTFMTGDPKTPCPGKAPQQAIGPSSKPKKKPPCPGSTPGASCPPIQRLFNVSKEPCPNATFDVQDGPQNRTYKVKCPPSKRPLKSCPPQNTTYNVCTPSPGSPTKGTCPRSPAAANRTFPASPSGPAPANRTFNASPAANRTFPASPASAANRTFSASPSCPAAAANQTFTASPPPAANRTFVQSPASPPPALNATYTSSPTSPVANRTFSTSPPAAANRTFTQSPACPSPAANRTFTSTPPMNQTYTSPPPLNQTFTSSPGAANRTFTTPPAANRTFSQSPACPAPAANRTFSQSPACPAPANRTFSQSPACPALPAPNACPMTPKRRNYRPCPR